MDAAVATIRELRTDFREVKRKMEEFGEVVITDHGAPLYVLKPYSQPPKKAPEPIDFYARLTSYQPVPMSQEESKRFWEEERGDR